MKYTLITYFDKQTEQFNPCFTMPFDLDGTIETIKNATIKGKIEDAKFFEAFHLGFFDADTGLINLLEKPLKVLDLSQYVRED